MESCLLVEFLKIRSLILLFLVIKGKFLTNGDFPVHVNTLHKRATFALLSEILRCLQLLKIR